MKLRLPNYIKYIFTNTFFLFVFIFLFRVIFYNYSAQLENAPSNEVLKAFWLGIRFDIKLVAIVIFPLTLLILIVNHKFLKRIAYKKIAAVYLVISYLAITLFYLMDFGYNDYLSTRLDATSLRFTTNLDISTQVLFESYPVYKGFFGLLVVCFLVYKLSNWVYKKFNAFDSEIISKKIKAIYFTATFLLLAFEFIIVSLIILYAGVKLSFLKIIK